MRGAGRKERGYTLIELVLVIILLGVVAFVAVPRLFNRSAFEGTSFYDRFIAALHYARAVAVASNCPVDVKITSTSFTLTHESGTSLCPASALPVRNPATGNNYTAGTPSGWSFGSGTGTVTFAVDGSIGSTDKTVTLNSGTTVLTVTIYASTGYAARG